MNDTHYAAPTPQKFYIHDDLSDEIRHTHGAHSLAFRLTQELFQIVQRDAGRVVVLHVAEQIAQLVAQGPHTPFAVTIGIARAGERVAQQLHARTGWFPTIQRVDVTREEDGRGGYTLVSTAPTPLAAQLAGIEVAASLAVVDDTVFSGFTMRTVLQALPAGMLQRTHAFCLRGVAQSLPGIRALCPLSIGFAAAGRITEEVSFINASGLVLRVGIRRAGKPPLAFFDRLPWLQAWFPGYAEEVRGLCQQLNALLEPAPQGQALPAGGHLC
jgi:pyrimidine operon attenuation protein/uracil phosphoribosyltransferase